MTNALHADARAASMAYVDGEMSEAELIAFEARVAVDAALFDAVGRERALRDELAAHYSAVLDEPTPAALLDLLGMSTDEPAARSAPPSALAPARLALLPQAAPSPPAPPARTGASWLPWGGMAACLLSGVLLGAHLVPTGSDASPFAVDEHGALAAVGPLRDALERRLGGTPDGNAHDVTIGISFHDRTQDYCRTFAVDTAKGIACKWDGRWTVANLERAPVGVSMTSDDAAHATACTLSPTLLLAIGALRDGDTLDAAAESAARAQDWQR